MLILVDGIIQEGNVDVIMFFWHSHILVYLFNWEKLKSSKASSISCVWSNWRSSFRNYLHAPIRIFVFVQYTTDVDFILYLKRVCTEINLLQHTMKSTNLTSYMYFYYFFFINFTTLYIYCIFWLYICLMFLPVCLFFISLTLMNFKFELNKNK